MFIFSLYTHIMYIFFKNAEEMSSHVQDGAYFRTMLIKCIFSPLLTYHHLPPWWTWARKRQNTALSRISAAAARARATPPGSHCEGWPAFGSWMCGCFFWDPRWTTGRHSLQRKKGVLMKLFQCGFLWNLLQPDTKQQRDRGSAFNKQERINLCKRKTRREQDREKLKAEKVRKWLLGRAQ